MTRLDPDWYIVFAAIVAMAIATGCDAPKTPGPDAPSLSQHTTLSMYLDPETGCQYLGQRSSNAGITARIAADGKTHMGCKGGSNGQG
jgi:hypothetical protein